MLNNFKYSLNYTQIRTYNHIRPDNRFNLPYNLLPWTQRNEWEVYSIGDITETNLLESLKEFVRTLEDKQLYAVYFIYQACNQISV